MPDAATHTIRLQRIEVALNGTESDGFALQNRLSVLCRDWLLPALDRALERYAPAEGRLVIEYIDIDVGELPLDRLEQEFPEYVRQAVETAIRDKLAAASPDTDAAPAGSAAVFKSDAQATWEAFIYFLETGRLPWAFRLLPGETLEDKVLAVLAAGADARRRWTQLQVKIASRTVRLRLIRQFSPAFLNNLAERIVPETAAATRQVLAVLRPHLSPASFDFWGQLVWATALAQRAGIGIPPVAGMLPKAAAIPENIQQLLVGSLLEAERQRPRFTAEWRTAIGQGPTEPWVSAVLEAVSHASLPSPDAISETPPGDDLPTEGLLVDYAGLVLLHPFLPQFFHALGVADDLALTQPDRALHLLHFLATGATAAPEHELTFAKILCGMPLGQPVDAHIELTDTEREEAVNLLQTVIRYWDALKETSPDGLREVFFNRPGKLVAATEGGWRLKVETRTHDILLEQLPWGIGMVQLPWMPAILQVEWG